MQGKLVRWGDDLAVRLSPEEARELGLYEGQTVEVLPKINRMTLAEMVAEAKRLGPAYEPPTVDWGPDRGSEIIDGQRPTLTGSSRRATWC